MENLLPYQFPDSYNDKAGITSSATFLIKGSKKDRARKLIPDGPQ